MRVLLSWETNRYLLNGTFSDPNRLCRLDGGLDKETQKEAQLIMVWPRCDLEKTQQIGLGC